MKIKKIAAQVREQCRADIMDVTDGDGVVRQWISTGVACYPVDGMPYLMPEHLPTVLDLTAKQTEEIRITRTEKPESMDFRDAVEHEIRAEGATFAIYFSGIKALPLIANGVAYFVDAELLAPILAEYKEVDFWLRRAESITYFAVKFGLMVVGVVLPMTRMQDVADEISEVMARYHDIPRRLGSLSPDNEEIEE